MYSHIQINSFPTPVLVWNQRGIIIAQNKSLEKLLGYDQEELLGRNIRNIMSPDKCGTNASIYHYIDLKVNPGGDLDMVILTSKIANEDVYVMINFGEFHESDGIRYIASFLKPVIGNDTDKIKTIAPRIAKNQTISWICWSKGS
jgi:PAS domain-containing protein